MKRIILFASICLMCLPAFAQRKKKEETEKKDKEYVFTLVKELPYTSVKNQASSGTCWSFSGVSMLESEVLRLGKDTVDLSEMWIVRNSYFEKVEKYVRMHGSVNLAGGGAFYDVLHACQKYGIVPEEAYPGLEYGSDKHKHDELDRVLEEFGKSIVKTRNPSTAWKKALNGILDAYLGAAPSKFTYKGVEYTPQSFAQSLGLNIDDYVSLTSFTHHPFYSQFIIEVPDNWAYSLSYNVPLNEFQTILTNAINTGYSIAWATDVSEASVSRDMASVPEEKEKEEVGSDEARWTGQKSKSKPKIEEEKPEVEKVITQEMRQEAFDDYNTTDDHGMHIVGIVTDQDGRKYFKVKNSWGTEKGKHKGFLYATEPYVLYKTTNIVVHKNAIPADIRAKLKF